MSRSRAGGWVRTGSEIFPGFERVGRWWSADSDIDWGNPQTQRQLALFSRSGFTQEVLARARSENVVLVKEDQVVN